MLFLRNHNNRMYGVIVCIIGFFKAFENVHFSFVNIRFRMCTHHILYLCFADLSMDIMYALLSLSLCMFPKSIQYFLFDLSDGASTPSWHSFWNDISLRKWMKRKPKPNTPWRSFTAGPSALAITFFFTLEPFEFDIQYHWMIHTLPPNWKNIYSFLIQSRRVKNLFSIWSKRRRKKRHSAEYQDEDIIVRKLNIVSFIFGSCSFLYSGIVIFVALLLLKRVRPPFFLLSPFVLSLWLWALSCNLS